MIHYPGKQDIQKESSPLYSCLQLHVFFHRYLQNAKIEQNCCY